LRDSYQLAVVTNDIYTQEDARFLIRSQAQEENRIIGVKTGGCPHAANDGVDIKEGGDSSGGCVAGLFQAEEWPAYSIRLEQAGDFNIDLRVSRGVASTGRAHIEVDGTDLSGSIPIPSTAGRRARNPSGQ
jgi:hypothetical protein